MSASSRSAAARRAKLSLATARKDTSTWGKRLEIKCGYYDPAGLTPWGPFTESPDAGAWKRLVDVRVKTDTPSVLSRDVTAYVVATQTYANNSDIVQPAQGASVLAVGAVYPTGFVGGETLAVTIDTTPVNVVFAVTDQTLVQVLAAINAASTLAGVGNVATDSGGQILLTSPSIGPGAVVDVTGGTGRATIGLPIATATGTAATKVQTPPAEYDTAFAGLFGRLETGRGGVTASEDFLIPAHGKVIHIGADAVRLSVGFFPDRAGWTAGFQGKRAAGFSVQGGVTTADMLPHLIRQFYSQQVAGTQRFDVPNFSSRLQFFTQVPEGYQFDWRDQFGTFIPNTPSLATPYVDSPQPIPIDAASLQITPVASGLAIDPVIMWERSS
ncbi:MAG: hypothetical protein OEZ01_00535 [Candidatus Heimdallarchaeota archaeon]|nr:hypothetical protein [Candidatus Heimdallarchaeota archaeon]MDH5676619.1 hypothetical protein [Myxococcales bacterium]